jgi:PBSX family phage terminase large subunit
VAEAIMKPFGKKARNFILRPPEQDTRYTVLEGAVRSSKTFAVTAKMIVQLTRYKVGGKRVICGTSKATVHRNILLDLEAVVGRGNYAYNMSTGQLTLFDTTWFVLASRDEASYKNLLGSTVGIAILDEAVEAPQSFFSQLLLRMSPTGARLYATTNPGSPYSTFKTDFLDAPAIQKDLTDTHFTLGDNPNIDESSKQAIIASQSGVYKLRYIDGLWVLATGSIYKDAWDDYENVCVDAGHKEQHTDGRQYMQEPIWLKNSGGYVDHYFAVDAGVDHPQVTYEFYDTGDILYVTREDVWDSKITMRQRTDKQYADALRIFMVKPDYQVIVPPEAASYKAQLASDGFWVTDADNAVSDGIHTVSSMMCRRKLIVNKDQCPRLAKAIPAYAWDAKAAKLGSEEPKKINDDEVDAMRYGVHGKIPKWRVAGG